MISRTVRQFIVKLSGKELFEGSAEVSPASAAIAPDEFVRLSDEDQSMIVSSSPALERLLRGSTLALPSIADEVLDVVHSSWKKLATTSASPGVCRSLSDLCDSTPADSTRWRALRALLDVADPSWVGDPRILMGRLLDSAFDMATWLPALGRATVDTELVALSPNELRAMKAACEASEKVYFAELCRTSGASAESGRNWLEAGIDMGIADKGTAAKVRQELCQTLSLKIDGAIQRLRQRNPGCSVFVKLSSRSPKDSLALRARKSMRVEKGIEAVELLACSKRVTEDVTAALEAGLPLNVAVRVWSDVERWSEVRAFACHRKLTAMSRYFASTPFPELTARKEELVSGIRGLFESEIRDRLPFENAVIDFAIIGGHLMALEINPFSRTTGACLFRWSDDCETLCGLKPFEVRF